MMRGIPVNQGIRTERLISWQLEKYIQRITEVEYLVSAIFRAAEIMSGNDPQLDQLKKAREDFHESIYPTKEDRQKSMEEKIKEFRKEENELLFVRGMSEE